MLKSIKICVICGICVKLSPRIDNTQLSLFRSPLSNGGRKCILRMVSLEDVSIAAEILEYCRG